MAKRPTQSGELYNLLADDWVGSHSDVEGQAIAYAIVEAVASTL